ncbi:MAG: GNAT family N-acetyltransferase, partial [Bacilli bacterium]|nr:GNAT family N-acetyltransferase [Bacilli bacterium]
QNLKDDEGLKIAVPDEDEFEKKMAIDSGYQITDQTETIMSIDLDKLLVVPSKEGMTYVNLDPIEDYDELCYLFRQGFDHGDDREECKRENPEQGSNRVHYNPYLSITVKMDDKYVAHVSLWYSEKTDYAYVEPVCVIPTYRHKGIGRAMIYEALNRARSLGAKKAYVISDMEFYEKLGFKKEKHYTFYQKK